MTNPPKKGTYGMFKTTLGERMGPGGACGEYSYKPSPYDEARRFVDALFNLLPAKTCFRLVSVSESGHVRVVRIVCSLVCST